MTEFPLNIKVAVMGCVVNGPGGSPRGGSGIAGGQGEGLLMKHGEVIRKVPEGELLARFAMNWRTGMNEKPFFEVFKTLQLGEQEHALFEQAIVTRVSMTPARDVLRVYMTSKKLIAKDQLFHLAKQIQKQIFGVPEVQVLIFEKFQLSGAVYPGETLGRL